MVLQAGRRLAGSDRGRDGQAATRAAMDLTLMVGRLPSSTSQILYYDGPRVVQKDARELHADVGAMVLRLRACGVVPGMRVGLLASNGYGWIVSCAALLELRCQLVALPEEFRDEAAEALGDRYQLGLLIVSAKDGWYEATAGGWVLSCDAEDPPGIRARGAEACDPAPDFEENALVFSSGTSGKLKCMITSRRGTEEMIECFHRHYRYRTDDRLIVFLPLSNYQQQMMAFAALWYGFALIVVEPRRLFQALRELGPTQIIAPPMFYEAIATRFHDLPRGKRILVDALGRAAGLLPFPRLRDRVVRACFGPVHASLGGRVRLMLTGMAPIRSTTLKTLTRLGLPLYEVYGVTECGIVTLNTPGANRPGSVGRPVEAGCVELAEDGEIIVRKRSPLTRGYLGGFGDDGTTYLDGDRVATGDIGRFDRDGYLYITGRKKEIIVTSGGQKIHPETVESQINECPAVAHSVVFGADLPDLVAVVSLRPDTGGNSREEVRRFLGQLGMRARGRGACRVGKVLYTETAFTRDNGLLTRNLKLDRKAILRHFQGEFPSAESV